MKNYNFIIADDEEPAAHRLRGLMKKYSQFIDRGTYYNGATALKALRENDVDVIFLDIEMPDMSGMDVLDSIPEKSRPLVVFVTAYDRYAVLAFEYFAIDYLLKPFSNERFAKMISQVETRLATMDAPSIEWQAVSEAIRTGNPQNTIVVKTGKRHHFIAIDDIAWISASGNYCDLHLLNGNVHVHRSTITQLCTTLPGDRFIRIHQSHIIRVEQLKSVHRLLFGEMEVKLKDDTKLKVSRAYKHVVRGLLKSGPDT